MILSQPNTDQAIFVKNVMAYYIEVNAIGNVFAKVFAESQTNQNDFAQITSLSAAAYQNKQKFWFCEVLRQILFPIPPQTDKPTEQIFLAKKAYLSFGTVQSNTFYAILAARNWLQIQTNKTLGRLLSKPVKHLAPDELDFMTVFFEINITIPIRFKINYEGFSHNFSENIAIKKFVITNIPIGFAQKNYQQYHPNQSIKSVEVFVGGTMTTTAASKPIRFVQIGNQIEIQRNDGGSFIDDGWKTLNYPYYLSTWFFWHETNPYQTFSLLGLIKSPADVFDTKIIFDRIGEPIQDPLTLANEGLWLPAELRLVTAQSGGITVPENPPKIQVYGNLGTSTVTSAEAHTIIFPKKSHCKKGFEKNFIYLNSLGAWESLFCEGEFEENTNIEQDILAHHVPADYANTDAVLQQFNTEYFKSYKARTGFFPKKFIQETIIDFLASEYRMLFLKDYGFVPIVILSKKYLTNTEKTLLGIEFEFRFSHNEIAPVL